MVVSNSPAQEDQHPSGSSDEVDCKTGPKRCCVVPGRVSPEPKDDVGHNQDNPCRKQREAKVVIASPAGESGLIGLSCVLNRHGPVSIIDSCSL